MSRTFTVGTRGSRLALRQTEIALDALRALHPDAIFEVRTIRTEGDATSASLSEIGGRGVFVIEIERALLAGEIDIAVHSLKDLPSNETPGVTIAAVLERGDPRDVLVSRNAAKLQDLPRGATIGTGSPRRACQILALRPDLRITDIRGNVDTRVRKADEGEYDAVVLAAAGLARLDCLDRSSQIFEPEEMLPAPGQAVLAIQTRSDDPEALALVSVVDDPETRVCITAERAFERTLDAGCQTSAAAYATLDAGNLRMRGLLFDEDLKEIIREDHDVALDLAAAQVRGIICALAIRSRQRVLRFGRFPDIPNGDSEQGLRFQIREVP